MPRSRPALPSGSGDNPAEATARRAGFGRSARSAKDRSPEVRHILAVSEQRAWRSGGEVRALKSLEFVEGLRSLGRVTLAVRMNGVPRPPGVHLTDADSVAEIPWSDGSLAVLPRLVWTVTKAVRRADLVFCDQPGIIGGTAAVIASMSRKPFFVNVVGNPSESMGPDVIPGPRGAAARAFFTALQRFACRHAMATNYVTRTALQGHYPPLPTGPSFTLDSGVTGTSDTA